jgi:hypothetical protein
MWVFENPQTVLLLVLAVIATIWFLGLFWNVLRGRPQKT